MLRAYGHGLLIAGLAFVGLVLWTAASGTGPDKDAGSILAGGMFFLVMFYVYGLMFSLPFVVLTLGFAAATPDWTSRNPWMLAVAITGLVAAVFTTAQGFQVIAIGVAALVSGLFAWRWTRRAVSP